MSASSHPGVSEIPAEADVVVVGGGSAGAAVAGTIAELSELRAVLLEAGPDHGPKRSGGWPEALRPENTGSALSDLIAATVVHYYHPAGSCKMSSPSDPLAVVDHHGAVHGVGGLFVVDASIMPTVVSGNTSMPTIVIGEKVGRFISGED
jgi:choline dehydrogenase-like flavoprotein